VRLPLPDVSRRHCRFVWRDGVWQVIDMNSLNGVFVNGERVQQVPLRTGDMIRLGGFTFRVQLPGGMSSAEERATATSVLRSIADALPDLPEQRRAS
jgi:pSer/pThr/pTyr-binding forkhead associated (FHA) protein